MPNFDSRSQLIELSPLECLALLGTRRVGRVAFLAGKQPMILPVNYAVDGQTIVFRTDRGTKLSLLITEPVSFEVDLIDTSDHTGWSVVVQGLAYEASPREIEVEDLHVEPLAPGRKPFWARLMPQSITGRRIRFEEPAPLDPRGYV